MLASSVRGRNNAVNNYRVRCEKAQANVVKYQGIVDGYQQQLPNATDSKTKKSVLRNINLNTARLAAAQRSTNINGSRYGELLQAFEQRKAECLAQFPNTVTPTPIPTGGPVATPIPNPMPTYYLCGPGSPVTETPRDQSLYGDAGALTRD